MMEPAKFSHKRKYWTKEESAEKVVRIKKKETFGDAISKMKKEKSSQRKGKVSKGVKVSLTKH